MFLLLEYSPLIAFGIGYWVGGMYVATATLMVAMTLMLAIVWLWKRRVTTMNVVSTVMVLALGSLTLLLHNARFIQWKPSLFLWLLGAAFLGSVFIGTQPLAQRMLQPVIGDAQVDRRAGSRSMQHRCSFVFWQESPTCWSPTRQAKRPG